MRSLVSLTCLALLLPLMSAEDLPKPQVPDPFGLGERLALVDYLRDTCKLAPPPDATMEHLVAMYWKHHRKEREAIHEDATDQALAADRMRRLRSELKERYQIDAPADADEGALGRLLNDARTKATSDAVQDVLDKAAARDNPANAAEAARYAERDRAAAQVRLESIDQDERSARAELQQLDEQRRGLARQAHEQQDVLASLRERYNEEITKHNNLVNLYEKKTQEGSSDALRTLEQIQDQRKLIDQAKLAIDKQEAVISELAKKDEALVARRRRVDEILGAIARRRAEEQAGGASGVVRTAPGGGPATPGGFAEAPVAGSQQARLVAGVVLLVVKDRGTGTGFLVSNDGLVVTNAHVLGDRNVAVVAMWDAGANRRPVRMTVVDFAEADDLALLKAVDGAPFEPLPMNEVYELQRPLIAAGFPLAGSVAESLQTSPSDIVVSRGILGSVRRGNGRVEWLQHDCRVASGNSGGPVIDQTTGAVIGVTTKVLATDGINSHGDGINLAIPIRKVMDRFAKHLRP
jgi:S1-C subfamily serine protease